MRTPRGCTTISEGITQDGSMNWKADKDGVLIVVANILLVAWCAFCFFGCAAKQKAVDKAKSETSETARIETNESAAAEIKAAAESSGLTAYDFSELISKWRLDYDGEINDGFRFYLNQTDTGWEAGAEGKGKATAQTKSAHTEARTEIIWKEKFDSLALISQSKLGEYESRIKQLEQSKSVEKKSTGFQAGTYIIVAIALLALILLYWLGWKIRAFLNRF